VAHSEQQYSANMVATVVLVVFERFAFAAENLPAMKRTIQIIAKQY
jgi:hypothetical protein